MKPLFDPSLYQFDQPQPSYWEASAGDVTPQGKPLAGTQSCDVAIIGGGYSGLSAALHLARDFNIDVTVLQAGHVGWGASGRNGGFCTMGATKLSLKSQIARFGIQQTRHFYQSQADAVNLVRSIRMKTSISWHRVTESSWLLKVRRISPICKRPQTSSAACLVSRSICTVVKNLPRLAMTHPTNMVPSVIVLRLHYIH